MPVPVDRAASPPPRFFGFFDLGDVIRFAFWLIDLMGFPFTDASSGISVHLFQNS